MSETYWKIIWRQYRKSKVGVIALLILTFFCAIGIYAPLFASSKPLVVEWNGTLYFPLLRYLFYPGFFTKSIDIFFNIMMFTLPIALAGILFFKGRVQKYFLLTLTAIHVIFFGWVVSGGFKDPSGDKNLEKARLEAKQESSRYYEDPILSPFPSHVNWSFEQKFLAPYAALNEILSYRQMILQHTQLLPYQTHYAEKKGRQMPTLWEVWQRNENEKKRRLLEGIQEMESKYNEAQQQLAGLIEAYRPFSHLFLMAKYALKHASADHDRQEAKSNLGKVLKDGILFRAPLEAVRHTIIIHQKNLAELQYLEDKKSWLEQENKNLHILFPPLLRFFHWQEDAGGGQEVNQFLPWWQLTRINRRDLFASLMFGIRVSLVVGLAAVGLSLLIGIPLGTLAGYFAGKTDLVICRVVEMWEAMPTFFMLLLVVAITQSKSIFLVIGVLGIFGWTGIARYMRSEVLKQRKLSYVMACHSLGYTHNRIMFSHILPNAIAPILTLLPFSMMAAITSEAGLSFLGLGEEGSTSWGVLMDEGRSVFPAESYLLWPPAVLLTLLLISIALVGDRLRDAIDPKMR